MIFEDWELKVIEDKLSDNDLVDFGIKVKIKEIRKISNNKRYTLRTTDWLSESGKKRRGKKKIKNKINYCFSLERSNRN